MSPKAPATAQESSSFPPATSNHRLLSLDTYRGIVLFLLLFESVEYGWQRTLADHHPNDLTQFFAFQASHVPWVGCSLWDLIQPSFMFMVGVSMPYSYGKRKRLGDRFPLMLRHAITRAFVLIILGVFLRTTYTATTNWTFEDVISQIGLGYTFLFLLWNTSLRTQLISFASILVGYWLLFALWPIREPIPSPDWGQPDQHLLHGFFSHWNINANPGHEFDLWFLNLFPRSEAFILNSGGYNTLNFIPSLGVMIMGLIAGTTLRSEGSAPRKLRALFGYGLTAITLGGTFHFLGICPLVKKSWTSGFTLFSGGCCFVILASLYFIVDVKGKSRWTFPFIVCGMNSIALYCMLWLLGGSYPVDGSTEMHSFHWIDITLQKHLSSHYAMFLGEGFAPLLKNIFGGSLLWLVCFWMYRRKIFLRI